MGLRPETQAALSFAVKGTAAKNQTVEVRSAEARDLSPDLDSSSLFPCGRV
jgi:hypothetical protein